jgi:hypothetical protein
MSSGYPCSPTTTTATATGRCSGRPRRPPADFGSPTAIPTDRRPPRPRQARVRSQRGRICRPRAGRDSDHRTACPRAALWTLAFHAGLRIGEIRCLRWNDTSTSYACARAGMTAPGRSTRGVRRHLGGAARRRGARRLIEHKLAIGRDAHHIVFGPHRGRAVRPLDGPRESAARMGLELLLDVPGTCRTTSPSTGVSFGRCRSHDPVMPARTTGFAASARTRLVKLVEPSAQPLRRSPSETPGAAAGLTPRGHACFASRARERRGRGAVSAIGSTGLRSRD